MRSVLGIDVGSTTAKVVVVAASGELLHAERVRHAGRPREVVRSLIERARASHDAPAAAVAGSIGVALADELGAIPIHEVQALVLSARDRYPGCRSIVELGGQDAKIVTFGAGDGAPDTQMNDRCAAGTGATIDRIARRLGIDGDQLASLRLCGQLRVASKCGVFAETDLVNLVQQGATQAEALSALMRAIVVQNLSVLARGRLLRPPLLLLGGPHAHVPMLVDAWRQELAELWRQRAIEPAPLVATVIAPTDGDLFVALGAAHHARAQGRALSRIQPIVAVDREQPALLDGEASRHALTSLRCGDDQPKFVAGRVAVHVGVDAGSTSVKAVVLDATGQLLASVYGMSTGNPLQDARQRLRELVRIADGCAATLEVRSLGVTGYGAAVLSPLLGADVTPVETVAHAAGACAVDPDAEVVVDVGGTDIKVLRVVRGEVRDFFVSNQCSAGHGAFLAATAADMGVALHEFAERAFSATRAPRFTVGCAIFMDSDRVGFQRDGFTTDEILAGLASTVARNVWEFVVPHAPEQLGRRFVLTGGTQRNLAAAYAQWKYLRARIVDAQVRVHPQPELCGAIGAALLAREHARTSVVATRFVGFEALARVRLNVQANEALRCGGCELSCARSLVQVDNPPAASRTWLLGNTCERGADISSRARRHKDHAVDLFGEEALGLFRWPRAPRPVLSSAPAPSALPVVGIPRILGMYRAAPLLLAYLSAVGLPRKQVIWSPPTSPALFQDGARRGSSDACYPSKVIHAHVDWLLSRRRELGLNVLWMPTITHAAVVTHGTADCASCPIVAASGYTALAGVRRQGDPLADASLTVLLDQLNLAHPDVLETQLHAAFGPLLGLSRDDNRVAVLHALAVAKQRALQRRVRGARVLAEAQRAGRAVAVILARPYHLDPGIAHGVSVELSSRGIPVLDLTSLPLEPAALRDLGEVAPEVTNSGCGEKLWAARVVKATPNLVAVDLSSFRCGQDASILAQLTALLATGDKPALWLHDLDEDRPATSFRLRIDTFTAALRRYEQQLLPNDHGQQVAQC